MNTAKLLERNAAWAESRTKDDGDYFADMAKGQSPDLLYIGCSDSRVTAEEMMGAGPGEIFVHRNVANVVPNADMNVLSVIEYAVGHLHVKDVVVCGHYECGGVKAGMGNQDLEVLNPWLRNIRDVARLHADELAAIGDEERRYRRLVELNAEEQAVNVIKTEVVQKAMKAGEVKVHAWVFDIATGRIKDLGVDFDRRLEELSGVFGTV